MEKIRAGFFTYPWDLIEPNPENIIAQMVEENNVNAIMVNAIYHHARMLRPRVKGPQTYQNEQAFAAFEPNPIHYEENSIIPIFDKKLANAGVLKAVGESCKKHKVDFGIWLVGLHNSSIGKENPALCVENCFGDIYTYSLCPSQRKNQQYLLGLVRDVYTQFKPDRVLLEAIGVLGLKHWVHHELIMTEWDEILEMLTSICFCSACTQKAEENGLNIKKLRKKIVSLGNQLLNEERGALPQEFTQGEVTSLLFEIDELWVYLQVQTKTISSMVAEIQEVATEFGMSLEISPSSFHRPVSRAWMERVSINELGKTSDGLVLSSYFKTSAEVEADLRWAKYLSPDVNLSVGINACAPTSSEAELLSQSQACINEGCHAVYFYNYGLLNQKRLEWASTANKLITESDVKGNKNG